MLWLILKDSSHCVVSCNTSRVGTKYQVWVERSNGKNLRVGESESEDDVNEIKDAIDYAISEGIKTLSL